MDIENYEHDCSEKKLLIKLQEAEIAVKDDEGWLEMSELKVLMENKMMLQLEVQDVRTSRLWV